MNNLTFQVVIAVEKEDEGYYGYCPDLKGVHVYGDTEEKALATAKDAAMCYLLSAMEHGDPMPLGTVRQNVSEQGPSWWKKIAGLRPAASDHKEFIEDLAIEDSTMHAAA